MKSKSMYFVALFLVVVVMVSIVGCAKGEVPAEKPPVTPPKAAEKPPVTPPKVYEFVAESVYPPHNVAHISFENRAKLIEERSDGRIKIKIFPGAQLVPAREALDATGKGTIDVLFSAGAYYAGKVPLFSFTVLPFYFQSYKDMFDIWFERDDFKNIMLDEMMPKANVIALYPAPISSECFMMGKGQELRTIEDFEGKKIRGIGGFLGECLQLSGFSTVTLIGGEVYTALQTGVIDGALFPLYTLETYKMAEVCTSYSTPYFAPYPMALFDFMNLDKWNELPDDLQNIWLDASKEYAYKHDIKYWDEADKHYLDFAKKGGMEFIELPAEDVTKWKEMLLPAYDGFVASCGEPGEKLYSICEEYAKEKGYHWPT